MSMSDFSQHVPLSTFLQAHPDQGSLRVQVASGGGTFPVAGARVEVYLSLIHILSHLVGDRAPDHQHLPGYL